jgi:hypothetical protein
MSNQDLSREELINQLKIAYENNHENLSSTEKDYVEEIMNSPDVVDNKLIFVTKFLKHNENKLYPTPLSREELSKLPLGAPLMIVKYVYFLLTIVPYSQEIERNDLSHYRFITFARSMGKNDTNVNFDINFPLGPNLYLTNTVYENGKRAGWPVDDKSNYLLPDNDRNKKHDSYASLAPFEQRIFKLNDEFYNKYFINVLRSLPGIGEDYFTAKDNFENMQQQELWHKLFKEMKEKVPVKEGGKRKRNRKTRKLKKNRKSRKTRK